MYSNLRTMSSLLTVLITALALPEIVFAASGDSEFSSAAKGMIIFAAIFIALLLVAVRLYINSF